MSRDLNAPLDPPPLPEDRPAASWSWPLILLSVFFIGWSVNLFIPKVVDERKENENLVDPGDLALFKIQSQIVIAAGPFSPGDALDTLEELRGFAQNDAMILALALVEGFLQLENTSPEKTLEELSSAAEPEMRALVEKALKSGITEEERVILDEQLGWFAKLAPSIGGEDPPEAANIRIRAMAFLAAASFLFIGIAVGVVAGAILLILQHAGEKKNHRFSSQAGPRGVVLESFALYLGIMALGEVGGLWIHPWISYASYLLAVIVPFLWPLWRGVSGRDFRRSIGWHRGEGIWREIGAGFVGYLKVMAIASIGILITLLLSATVGAFQASTGEGTGQAGAVGPETHPIVGWIYLGGWVERLLCFLLAAAFAPVFEEIFFRGALHRWLRGRFNFLISALLTGAIFAALHPQGWLGIPALAAIGVGFSLLRESRDSLIAPMVAHSINNGVIVTILCLAL